MSQDVAKARKCKGTQKGIRESPQDCQSRKQCSLALKSLNRKAGREESRALGFLGQLLSAMFYRYCCIGRRCSDLEGDRGVLYRGRLPASSQFRWAQTDYLVFILPVTLITCLGKNRWLHQTAMRLMLGNCVVFNLQDKGASST